MSKKKLPTLETCIEIAKLINSISLPFEQVKIIKKLLEFIESVQAMIIVMNKYPKILMTLRREMGFIKSSEKGDSLQPEIANNAKNQKSELEKRCQEKPEYTEAKEKIEEANEQLKKYRAQIARSKNEERKRMIEQGEWQKKCSLKQEEPLSPESIFTGPVAEEKEEEIELKVSDEEKMQTFGRITGLHHVYEDTQRLDLSLVATKKNYRIETVTDPISGQSIRASCDDHGPKGFNVTWRTISLLSKLHFGFAIPLHRLEMIFGSSILSKERIYSLMYVAAQKLLPSYLASIDLLADANVLSGDDTKTRLLEANAPDKLIDPEKPRLHQIIDEILGWRFKKKQGGGLKKQLNMSVVMGQTDPTDKRSYMAVFRTHFGSVGDLLNYILSNRSPKKGPVVIQTDLSTTNYPGKDVIEKIPITYAGCMAHARRPFWRYKKDDLKSCFYLLRAFALLSKIEKYATYAIKKEKLQGEAAKAKRIYWRDKFARRIWKCILEHCKKMVDPPNETSKGSLNYWPKQMSLNEAARYIIKNFKKLTTYCKNADIELTNNLAERLLRFEAIMLCASKFRMTREGRACYDIWRTSITQCNFAGVALEDYLRWVWIAAERYQLYPEETTPYGFACWLDRQAKNKPAAA